MDEFSFTVPGIPCPKGSMKGIPNRKTGGVILMHASSDKLKRWESDVKLFASKAGKGPPTREAVNVDMEFTFIRPRCHYGTGKNSDKLKESAPAGMIQKPDIDKLARAVLDGMTGVVFEDDKQVVCLGVEKEYGETAHVYVSVSEG